MPGPSLKDKADGYLTTTEAAARLGITPRRLRYWLSLKLLPDPTMTRRNGIRLFSSAWVEQAQVICQKLKEA